MGSILGIYSRTEEVPYKVIVTDDKFEIRQYYDRIVVETLMRNSIQLTDGSGFRTLAAYISGRNSDHKHIAMTSPVEVRPNERCAPSPGSDNALLLKGSGMFMRFTLPHDMNEGQVPKPLSQNVNIEKVGEQQVAALRFSGPWCENSFQEHAKALLASLQDTEYRAIGPVVSLRYDPPWTLSCFRRNEVAVDVMKLT